MVPVEQLSSLKFFEGLPPDALRALAAGATEVHLGRGEYAVHQHAEAQQLGFLLEGAVAFLLRFEGVDDLLVGASQERGLLIGWSAFRPPYRYTASVRCETPCRFLRVPKEPLNEIMGHDPRLGYEVCCRVAQAVAFRLEQTRDLLIVEPGETPPEGASY